MPQVKDRVSNVLPLLVVVAMLFLGCAPGGDAPDSIAATPPMGYNGWNAFGCDVDEQTIKQIADAMVSSGLKEVGYRYVNLDDCWMAKTRDAHGNLRPDPKKFPHGIESLADYVHSRGLKFGIYESAAKKTCAGYPGSLHHEKQDAKLFASWGVDYLKYDDCGGPQSSLYKMRDAIRSTGRPIVFSINGGWKGIGRSDFPKTARLQDVAELANLWRTTKDIKDNWRSFTWIVDHNAGLAKYAGPGHWNDPDMLEIGNGGMTSTEYRSQFSLWAMMAAPLIAGTDLRNMSPATKSILTNKDVIAVDQDPAGKQGRRVRDEGDREVWVKELSHGDRAVLLFNRSEKPTRMEARIGPPDRSYTIRDLWSHKETKVHGVITVTVPAHGVAMYRVYG